MSAKVKIKSKTDCSFHKMLRNDHINGADIARVDVAHGRI